MKDIPKKIYLQIGQEDSYDDVESFKEFDEVSWCSEKMHDSDIEYILAEPEGKEAVELWEKILGYLGGWREAIGLLEDHTADSVKLKNMMAAIDQIDEIKQLYKIWKAEAK